MDEKETWRMLNGYPGYYASSFGRITGSDNVSLDEWVDDDGVPHILHLRPYGSVKGRVCDLVVMAFYRGNTNKLSLIHNDGNELNNHLDNLTYVSGSRSKGNVRQINYRSVNGLRVLDRRLGARVMVIETGEIYESANACAKAIGGQQSNVYSCLNGRLRTHKGYSFTYV